MYLPRQEKFPAHSYEALFVELKQDGYQVEQGDMGFTIRW